MAFRPHPCFNMVARMLPLHTILEFEGLCTATRMHSLTGSLWAHLTSALYPGMQLSAACHGSGCGRVVKELLLLMPGVAFPSEPLRVETLEEAALLTTSLLRLKRELVESCNVPDYVPTVVDDNKLLQRTRLRTRVTYQLVTFFTLVHCLSEYYSGNGSCVTNGTVMSRL